MSDWLLGLISIGVALVVGSILAKIVAGLAGREASPDPVRENAGPIGSIVFSLVLVIGLVTALGFMRAEALDQIINDAVAYLPRAISAGIVIIAGNIVATIASTAAAQALARAAAPVARSVPTIVKAVILGFTLILGASQLGIDTTTINIAVAAMAGAIGLSMALLVGLGGREVASEIAAGRALKRVLGPGDQVVGSEISGTVITVHSVATEMEVDGDSVLLPNSTVLAQRLGVTRSIEPGADANA